LFTSSLQQIEQKEAGAPRIQLSFIVQVNARRDRSKEARSS
jgi:hypothetical protein